MIVALRCARSGRESGDVRRAAARSLDAWRSSGAEGVTVVAAEDPRGAEADWELLVREPEALVPPGPLAEAAEAGAAGETALVPEGVYPGGIGPPEPYVAVWQFEEARERRSRARLGLREAPAEVQAPAELRKRGSGGGPVRQVSGWLVHSFAGRRSWARSELLPLVPSGARKALEIGCAEGAFGELLERSGVRVTGIEPDRAAAAVAARRLTRVVAAPLEEAGREIGRERYDLVVLADVLEHLADPVAALRVLGGLLQPDGALLFSLPNAAHWAVLAGMLQGRFDHALEGIVADDHRTYAGSPGWERVLSAGGFTVERIQPPPLAEPGTDRWPEVLRTGGALEGRAGTLGAAQWIGLARKGGPGQELDLGASLPAVATPLDADDAVAEIRRLLLSSREVRLTVPNAVAAGNLLVLLDGGVVRGEGRSALARGFTSHGLRARFRGTGIEVGVASVGAGPLPETVRRLVERAEAEGLPVAPEALSASFLDVTFREGAS